MAQACSRSQSTWPSTIKAPSSTQHLLFASGAHSASTLPLTATASPRRPSEAPLPSTTCRVLLPTRSPARPVFPSTPSRRRHRHVSLHRTVTLSRGPPLAPRLQQTPCDTERHESTVTPGRGVKEQQQQQHPSTTTRRRGVRKSSSSKHPATATHCKAAAHARCKFSAAWHASTESRQLEP